MNSKARELRSALALKGFSLERKTTDDLFYFYFGGKKTQVHTKISMGRGEELRALVYKNRHGTYSFAVPLRGRGDEDAAYTSAARKLPAGTHRTPSSSVSRLPSSTTWYTHGMRRRSRK